MNRSYTESQLDDLQSKMDEARQKDKRSMTRSIIVDLRRKAQVKNDFILRSATSVWKLEDPFTQKPLDNGNLINLNIVWSGTAKDLSSLADSTEDCEWFQTSSLRVQKTYISSPALKVGSSSTLDAILWHLTKMYPTRVASNPHLYPYSAMQRIRESDLEPEDAIVPVPFTDTIDKIIQFNPPPLPLYVLADKESYVFLKSPTNPRVFRNIWTRGPSNIILKGEYPLAIDSILKSFCNYAVPVQIIRGVSNQPTGSRAIFVET